MELGKELGSLLGTELGTELGSLLGLMLGSTVGQVGTTNHISYCFESWSKLFTIPVMFDAFGLSYNFTVPCH